MNCVWSIKRKKRINITRCDSTNYKINQYIPFIGSYWMFEVSKRKNLFLCLGKSSSLQLNTSILQRILFTKKDRYQDQLEASSALEFMRDAAFWHDLGPQPFISFFKHGKSVLEIKSLWWKGLNINNRLRNFHCIDDYFPDYFPGHHPTKSNIKTDGDSLFAKLEKLRTIFQY